MIIGHMFGLDMLDHRNGCRSSTQEQWDEIKIKYPLNNHVEALLGIRPIFFEPVWDEVPIDEDKIHTMVE